VIYAWHYLIIYKFSFKHSSVLIINLSQASKSLTQAAVGFHLTGLSLTATGQARSPKVSRKSLKLCFYNQLLSTKQHLWGLIWY